MKQFFFKILSFIIPLCLLLFLGDWYISSLLSNSHSFAGEYEVMNDIYSGKAQCDVAIYGSSRAWVHLNPAILEDSLHMSVYNFGNDGQTFWLQYLRHLEFIENNPLPKYIIVSADIYTFEKDDELYNYEQYLPYMLWNSNICKYTMPSKCFSIADFYIPLLRYAGKTNVFENLKEVYNNDAQPERIRTKGFKGMDKQWNKDLEKARAERGKYTVINKTEVIQLFQQFLSECRSKGVTVVIVYTPEYIEGQSFVDNRDEVFNVFKRISKEYNVHFLDYTKHELCYDKKLFYNTIHMNAKGADLLTQLVAHDIKRIFPGIK